MGERSLPASRMMPSHTASAWQRGQRNSFRPLIRAVILFMRTDPCDLVTSLKELSFNKQILERSKQTTQLEKSFIQPREALGSEFSGIVKLFCAD